VESIKLDLLVEQFPGAVTVCDTAGIIVYQNARSRAAFARHGADLVGRSLEFCHQPESWAAIQALLRGQTANSYTIEKAGAKRIIHHLPWRENDTVRGLIELSLEIPAAMPHFVRD